MHLALPFFGIGMKTDLFQSCGHCWVFQICWHIEYSTFTTSSFRIWNSSTGIPSPLLTLLIKLCLEAVTDFIFEGLQNHCRWWQQPSNWKTLTLWKKCYDQPRQHIKKQRHNFVNKVRLVKAMVFPVVMYGCESWTRKKVERQRIDAFELWCWRRLSRVPCKEIQPVHSEGDQSWVFIGRTDAKAETLNTLATSCEELTH